MGRPGVANHFFWDLDSLFNGFRPIPSLRLESNDRTPWNAFRDYGRSSRIDGPHLMTGGLALIEDTRKKGKIAL